MRMVLGFLSFPVVTIGLLVGLATLFQPDRRAPQLAGFIYLGILGVSICAGYLVFRAIADDTHRRWPSADGKRRR